MIAIIVIYIILGVIAFIVILLHFSIKAEISVNNDDVDIEVRYFGFLVYPRPEKVPKKSKAEKKSRKDKKKSKSSDTPLSSDEVDDLLKQVDKRKNETADDEIQPKSYEEVKDTTQSKEDNTHDDEDREKSNKDSETEATDDTDSKSDSVFKEKINGFKAKIDDIKKKWKKIKPYVPTTWRAVKKLLKTVRFKKTSIVLVVGKEDAYESAMNYGKVNAAVFNGLSILHLIFTVKVKKCDVNCVFNENTFKYDIKTTIFIRPSALIAIAFCTLVNFG
ncbi:MAG: hypothetical protein GX896_03095, partial [Clostridiales bacterium]|nr:hypothetical protein [Clostridiales bacterium]